MLAISLLALGIACLALSRTIPRPPTPPRQHLGGPPTSEPTRGPNQI